MNTYDKKHLTNLNAYSAHIDAMYRKAIAKAAKMSVDLHGFNRSKPFSFSDYTLAEKQADKLVKWLSDGVLGTIEMGVRNEWTLSNVKNDSLVAQLLKGWGSVPTKYTDPNSDALDAFLSRKQNGLKLSDRVWQYSSRFKQEIELGLDLGIRSGRSADEISRDLRLFLNHPAELYRRVKTDMVDDDGHPIWHLSKAARDYHPGQGVYRSSYKNAKRLATTETNMAYRTADSERWQQLDFVTGMQIVRSKRHSADEITDICDDLSGADEHDNKGRYPKDFKFTGWHPQCRCFAVPITASVDEMVKLKETYKKGEQYTPNFKNVDSLPASFESWVSENSLKIARAADRDALPYFLRDNRQLFDDNFALKPKALTVAQQAEIRHAQRTEEDKKKITDAWKARQKDIQDTKQSAADVLKTASDYIEVNTTLLQRLADKGIAGKGLANIKAEIVNVTKAIQEQQKLETALSDVIPDVSIWHKQFTIAELQVVKDAVKQKLASLSSELTTRKSSLEFEIKWVEAHKKYTTWKVAQSAYKKALQKVEKDIDIKSAKDSLESIVLFAKTSSDKRLRKLLTDFDKLVISDTVSISEIKIASVKIINRYNKLLAQITPTSTIEGTPQTLINLDKAIKNYRGLDAELVKNETYLNAQMKKLFDDNDFGMDIKHEYLESVLDRGFLNTFQTGTSGGYSGSAKTSGAIETSHKRLGMSHRLFGNYSTETKDYKGDDFVGKQLDRSEYEKYGHLIDRDKKDAILNNNTWYGDVQVRFRKDKVKTTWTFNDSLSGQFQPTLTSDPKVHSFDSVSSAKKLNDKSAWNSLYKWQKETGTHYVELQYHGSLTADCVESLTFKDFPEKHIGKDILERWKEKQVEIWYYDLSDKTMKKY